MLYMVWLFVGVCVYVRVCTCTCIRVRVRANVYMHLAMWFCVLVNHFHCANWHDGVVVVCSYLRVRQYDTLFEQAVKATDKGIATLPYEPSSTAG